MQPPEKPQAETQASIHSQRRTQPQALQGTYKDPTRMPSQRPESWWKEKRSIRLIHLVLFGAMLCVFAVFLSMTSSRLRAANRQLEEAREELRGVLTLVGEKERQLQFTETDEYIEQQARERFGYIMPGEIRFMYKEDETLPEIGGQEGTE